MLNNQRSITFRMEGNPDFLVNATEVEGRLRFNLRVLGNGDLRGLFFDVQHPNLINQFRATGPQLTNQAFANEGITNIGGVNINGTHARFDAGLTFGSPGRGQDQIRQTSFNLFTRDGISLTLDEIANTEFGVRLTSKGQKIIAMAPAAPNAIDDTIVTDEDHATNETAPNNNLLANDTDADGNPLTIIGINGDSTLVNQQLTLDTGGLLTVHRNGTFQFNPNGQYDDLAWGESRTDHFTYCVTDNPLDAQNQGLDTASVSITVMGVNDVPIISVESGDSRAETLPETNTGLMTSQTITVSDVDTTDIVTPSVITVATSGNNSDPSLPYYPDLLSMLTVAPSPILDETETTDRLNWTFNSKGEPFNYLADDENLVLTYTLKAEDDNSASDTETVTVTIDGTNDQPIVQNLEFAIGEDDSPQSYAFVGSDLDASDHLSFAILDQPSDQLGHQYGSVSSNEDGTFTFEPLDNFQFLEAGESRDVMFSYVAIDDSGAPNAISEPKIVTMRVNGADDDPISLEESLLFESEDQSMFGTGSALSIDMSDLAPDIQSIELTHWNQSFNPTLMSGSSWDLGLLGTITTPTVSVTGTTSGRIDVEPYFSLTSGEVDTSIPVDVVFEVPRQVEPGETFTIGTELSVDNDATFETQSPSVSFGLDLVFEAAANATLNVSSSSLGGGTSFTLFDFDVDPKRVNLFDFSSGDLGYEYELPAGTGSLVLNFPDIATTGILVDPNMLTSQGSDTVATLDLDLDALLSLIPSMPPFGAEWSESLFDDALTLSASVDFLDADLISSLSIIQNFTLDIEDLPLKLSLEDNSTDITGFSVGDPITITAPTGFDPNTEGDADGLIDFDVDIDLKSVFDNLTTLGFNLDLFLGFLRVTAGVQVELPVLGTVIDESINVFGTSDGFLVSDTFNLFGENSLMTLFDSNPPFDLEGFNQETLAGAFDVA